MVIVRAKFDNLKEEVNSDLGIFAGDLVGILEKTSESHPEWKENLEDLLVVARQCAKMSPDEFWLKCEGIVQKLDDRRQELPMGTLKQVHTRLLFILARCTRLVQFQKESGYEEDRILAAHQLSDLGVYPEQLSSINRQIYKAPVHDQEEVNTKQDQVDEHFGSEIENLEVSSAKSVASSTGSYRMSSWKKLPSAAEKNRKVQGSLDSTAKKKTDSLQRTEETDRLETLNTSVFHPEQSEESLKVRKVTWGVWDQQNLTYEDSFICRICEVEIPTVYVEQHSRICTIVDRCDLNGLTANERLGRVAETLERILESWTPKSIDNGVGSPDFLGVSTTSIPEELDPLSPKQNRLTCRCSVDMPDSVSESDIGDSNYNFPDISCELKSMTPDLGKKASSIGSLTPRSPLVTPQRNQIELVLGGQKTIFEHESYQQVSLMILYICPVLSNSRHSSNVRLVILVDTVQTCILTYYLYN